MLLRSSAYRQTILCSFGIFLLGCTPNQSADPFGARDIFPQNAFQQSIRSAQDTLRAKDFETATVMFTEIIRKGEGKDLKGRDKAYFAHAYAGRGYARTQQVIKIEDLLNLSEPIYRIIAKTPPCAIAPSLIEALHADAFSISEQHGYQQAEKALKDFLPKIMPPLSLDDPQSSQKDLEGEKIYIKDRLSATDDLIQAVKQLRGVYQFKGFSAHEEEIICGKSVTWAIEASISHIFGIIYNLYDTNNNTDYYNDSHTCRLLNCKDPNDFITLEISKSCNIKIKISKAIIDISKYIETSVSLFQKFLPQEGKQIKVGNKELEEIENIFPIKTIIRNLSQALEEKKRIYLESSAFIINEALPILKEGYMESDGSNTLNCPKLGLIKKIIPKIESFTAIRSSKRVNPTIIESMISIIDSFSSIRKYIETLITYAKTIIYIKKSLIDEGDIKGLISCIDADSINTNSNINTILENSSCIEMYLAPANPDLSKEESNDICDGITTENKMDMITTITQIQIPSIQTIIQKRQRENILKAICMHKDKIIRPSKQCCERIITK